MKSIRGSGCICGKLGEQTESKIGILNHGRIHLDWIISCGA